VLLLFGRLFAVLGVLGSWDAVRTGMRMRMILVDYEWLADGKKGMDMGQSLSAAQWAVGDDIRLRGKLGTGKYNLAWRLGCWLAGPSLED
jgi:hypothetical protein